MGTGKSNRDAVGARVTATIRGQNVTQQVSGGQSYLSAPEKTLTFGLGGSGKIDRLEIRWPDGTTETLRDIEGGASYLVEEGRGTLGRGVRFANDGRELSKRESG